VSDIKPPQDSLSSYFDDLLGTGEPREAVQPAATKIAAGVARVVAMPQKNASVPKAPPETKKLNLVPASEPRFSDPESHQSEEQKQKLERLLQSARTQLLIEPVTETNLESKTETRIETTTAFQPIPDEIQEWDIETTQAVTVYVEALVETPEVEPDEIHQQQAYQIEGLEWLENGRPQWAQSRFDVLLFSVSGLTLAVPLISLGQIQPLTDELTPLFGQADWFMGLQPTKAGKIRTVNTAKFVMPERYDENFLKTAKYVVSINGVPWGLAVDGVNQPISLYPDDVKWRSDRSKRPWLAGTVKAHMCALLDIPRIGQMLVDADKNAVRRH
jgi:purine-binding chemotaxis protein CheW